MITQIKSKSSFKINLFGALKKIEKRAFETLLSIGDVRILTLDCVNKFFSIPQYTIKKYAHFIEKGVHIIEINIDSFLSNLK